MSKRGKTQRSGRPPRDAPNQRSVVWFGDWDDDKSLACAGYTTLAHSPEVAAGVERIASLVGAMTIHLMENGENGDKRIRNELSRMVDITPNRLMTRSSFIRWIVRTLYLDGDGNAVVYPRTENGYLRDLIPIPAAYTSFIPEGMWGYRVAINGRSYSPDEVLHFTLNPGTYYPWLGEGYRVVLKDVANNLKQAAATEKGFMRSKWKPSIIVKVDALSEEFSSPTGRKKLLEQWVTDDEAGQPWIVPAEQISVEQVKPLTLSDLALADFVTLDKKTVASILSIPPFVLGVGEFKRDAWNNFISTTIMPLAQLMEQVMTRGLLYNPNWFFRFNSRSLYNYELKDLANIADDQYVRGIMTGNEVRDWLGLSPMDGLNELVILENYIPRGMIGEQSKLAGGGNE